MRPGQDLDGLGQVTVTRDTTVVVAVGPDELGQHLGVTRIGLRPRQGVAVPIARRSPRVDRVHLVAGLDQRLDPQPAVGLDADHHAAGIVAVDPDQLVQRGHAFDALR